MKKYLVICWLAVLLSVICYLFWHNEWKYSLPTPVPANYKPVRTGTFINLDKWIKKGNTKPDFIHFFNPNCPCSRFNINQFRSIVNQYKEEVNFYIVVLSGDQEYNVKEIQEKFNLQVPVYFDSSIAASCGVYSTPQAALIDSDNRLYYRGNYNKSRYCTEKNSDYARLAIDSLLHKKVNPFFALTATKSYGCSLPGCVK